MLLVGFPEENRTGHLVEGVLQIHGLEASFIVVLVFPEPTSDGVTDGVTAVVGSEPSCAPQGCQRGTGNPRDSGAKNVGCGHDSDHSMEM